jgi:hypothetical protein
VSEKSKKGGPLADLLSDYTGFPGGMQQPQSSFNAIANVGPPPPPAQDGNKFAPGNIFAAMKKADYGKPEEQQPQSSSESSGTHIAFCARLK